MTNNEMGNYIKRYKDLNTEINRTIEKKERWKAKAEKTTPTLSDMPKGGDGESPRELAICEMMDCEMEINRLIDLRHNLRVQIKKHLAEIDDILCVEK